MKINLLLTGCFLISCTICDIKTKKIPVWLLLLFAVSGIYTAIRNQTDPLWMAFLPGAILLLIGYCTKESIGFGDGLIVLLLGLLAGFQICITSVIVGFFFSSVFAAILLISKKADRKSQIPYIPFLTAGFGATLWM